MVAKRGRPISDDSKNYMLRVRMDEQTLAKLDKCCLLENKTRSEIVRISIEERYSQHKKK